MVKNKFIFIGDILLCVAVAMLCIECVLISGSLKNMGQQIEQLKTQVASLTDANTEIQYDIDNMASDTDAQIQSINDKVDKHQTDYEKLNKELQKNTEEEKKEEPEEVSKEVNEVVETYVAYDDALVVVEESEPEPAPTPEVVENVESEISGMTYMGAWEVSAYEYTGYSTASGTMPTEWHTCAFNSAPLGATIYIPDLGYFVNEDICGTPSRLDIYLGDVDACFQFGIQYHNVYIVN